MKDNLKLKHYNSHKESTNAKKEQETDPDLDMTNYIILGNVVELQADKLFSST